MFHAMRNTLAAGHPAAVIAGTDAPSLPWARIAEALHRATECDLVLGPCRDGGYYLIGMRSAIPQLFEAMPWSTADVLAETLRRAEELSLKPRLLDPWYDVDTAEDLQTLRADLSARARAGQLIPCPRTWEYLRALPDAR